MTIVATTASVNRRYLVSKSKERLIGLYEQFTGKRLLSDVRNEMRLKRHRELVEIVWKAWCDLPSPLLGLPLWERGLSMVNVTPDTDPSPWHPETDPQRLKVLGKLAEEANELGAAIARCIIQGIDESEPVTGKVNRVWLKDEIADVLANIHVATENLKLDKERMSTRMERKASYIQRWLDGLTRPQET